MQGCFATGNLSAEYHRLQAQERRMQNLARAHRDNREAHKHPVPQERARLCPPDVTAENLSAWQVRSNDRQGDHSNGTLRDRWNWSRPLEQVVACRSRSSRARPESRRLLKDRHPDQIRGRKARLTELFEMRDRAAPALAQPSVRPQYLPELMSRNSGAQSLPAPPITDSVRASVQDENGLEHQCLC